VSLLIQIAQSSCQFLDRKSYGSPGEIRTPVGGFLLLSQDPKPAIQGSFHACTGEASVLSATLGGALFLLHRAATSPG